MSTFDHKSPKHIGDVELYFSSPSAVCRRQITAVAETLKPKLRHSGVRGKTTVYTLPNDTVNVSPMEVMEGCRILFGHIKSYNGCHMAILPDVHGVPLVEPRDIAVGDAA